MVERSDDRSGPDAIRVRGARVHNLRDIDVDIPRERLVALTGVSGSGKSSLAFDTLYEEGQRRYLETLSSHGRQFLDQLERPDVDAIDGLPATVSVDQRAGSANPRSTVATVTEIHDYLRVLYARAGTPHCPNCGTPIRRQTPERMVETVLAMRAGRKVLILAPLVRGRKGGHATAFQAVRRAGLLRARIDGAVTEIVKDDPKLAKTKVHDIEAVVDRLVVREGIRPRLSESIDLALALGGGTVLLSAESEKGWEDIPLSVNYACPSCGLGFEEVEPRTFSFNSPYGACRTCDGLGSVAAFDPELVVPNRARSLSNGAVAPWRDAKVAAGEPTWVKPFLSSRRLRRDTPLEAWPEETLRVFLHGEDSSTDVGVLPTLTRAYDSATIERRRVALEAFRSYSPCPECGGQRLRPEARSVKVGGLTLPELCELPVSRAAAAVSAFQFPAELEPVAAPLVREISGRLGFLDDVGLAYLTLARGASTLSGGELQRVRLASQIGAGLVGVCYVLDEPTAGLHPSDTDRLLGSLSALRDQGNTVIVVEHDERTLRAADWLIDLGPGAGPDGGNVVAVGPPDALVEQAESLTARYLGDHRPPVPTPSNRLERSPGAIVIHGASERNLATIDVTIPVGALTCVSGVSGSGKSTLVMDVLVPAVKRALGEPAPGRESVKSIEGLSGFDKLIVVDQAPIGRGPRSTPATYTGVLDEIRRVFARTREARARGYGPARFSFNAKEGRCEGCAGQGVRRLAMNFIADMFVVCPVCGGLRYNRQTLEVRFKGRSIGEVLFMRVDEAAALFDAQPKVKRGLDALHESGLGYVTLGQSSTTLSGGEAQRVKLAAELGRESTDRTLYVLDEPTTGLHFADVSRSLLLLNRLADRGNTVVVIEHNLDVLKTADWLVDLGPGGGENGGRLLVAGPPRLVADTQESVTGRYLRHSLAMDAV